MTPHHSDARSTPHLTPIEPASPAGLTDDLSCHRQRLVAEALGALSASVDPRTESAKAYAESRAEFDTMLNGSLAAKLAALRAIEPPTP